MKNSLNLFAVFLVLVVLGCNCPKQLQELSKSDGESNVRPAASAPSPAASAPTGSPVDYDVSLEKFDKIAIGMKRSEVEAIVGGRGTEYYSGKGGKSTFVSVKWVGEKYKTIFVSFRDETVTSKTQVGLNK